MKKNCIQCGAEMECDYRKRYCTDCMAKREKEWNAKSRMKRLRGNPAGRPRKLIETPVLSAPSMSIAQVNAMARKHGTSYGKYVVEFGG